MTDKKSPEADSLDDVYIGDDYGIGRSGYSPVVSLPAQKAETVSDWIEVIEIIAIILFIISVLLFVFGQIGVTWASPVATVIILLRGGTILVNRTDIVKPVEKFNIADEIAELEGDGTAMVFDDIELRVGVQDQQISMRFINNSIYDVSLEAEITSSQKCIEINERTVGFKLPTRRSDERVVHHIKSNKELNIDLEITDSIVESSYDIVIIDISGSILNKDKEKIERIEKKRVRVPIKVQNTDEIVSTTKGYEIVNG